MKTKCEMCGSDVDEPMNCECGGKFGPEYRELGGTFHEQRAFFFRDCDKCGKQRLIRMVKTWRW